jgi:hypothetical protein
MNFESGTTLFNRNLGLKYTLFKNRNVPKNQNFLFFWT